LGIISRTEISLVARVEEKPTKLKDKRRA